DELREISGITTAMMVTLGEDGVKTIEDFAGYAADDLVGWKERKDGETKVFPGVLAAHGVSKADAEQMVLAARLKAGWITEEEAQAEAAEAEAVGE
ncbi:helix-hairpin-helix domain-containing protein, partial [Klebsiella pneumoniae]